jgi:hypothetical protein
MKKVLVVLLILALGAGLALAKPLTFKETVVMLQKALVAKDMAILSKHIALESIVRGKIKKYAHKAEAKDSVVFSVAGRLVSLSEPLLTKTVTNVVLSEYGKASPGYISSLVSTMKFKKIGEKGNVGYAAGSFYGSAGYLAGLKNAQGDWIIVGADSPVLDQELAAFLKRLKLK